jgi:hypothetical protein
MHQTFPTTPESSIHSIGIWNSWYRTTSISLVRKNPFTLSSTLHQKTHQRFKTQQLALMEKHRSCTMEIQGSQKKFQISFKDFKSL